MRIRKWALLLLSAILIWPIAWATAPAYDLVITNGRIVDGTGNPWFIADIGIRDGRIAAIGRIPSEEAARVLDARGLIVAPGFIDVHTHVEGGILRRPTAENFLRMGVTTVVTGNCGGSWLPIGEALRRLEDQGLSINLATLVGHNTVRRAVMGEEARQPTPEELERMKHLVEQAMQEGAVGLSTGLIYIPGTYAKTEEIIELARVVAQYGGIYASHIRNEGNGVMDAIREAITIGERAGVPVQISHFKVSSKKLWGESRRTVQLVQEARARGLPVTVDQYVYPASSTGLETLLPSWVHDGGRAKAVERLRDPNLRARIKREMIRSIREQGFKDYSYAYVAQYRPDPSFNGKNIAEITRLVRRRASVEEQAEQIIEMFLASEGRVQMVYHKMHERDITYILQQPFTMIASDAGVLEPGQGVPHPRGYGNNARVFSRYVRESALLSWEEAVRKMTSLPAQVFGFWDRGMIRPGMAADLVIFDPERVRDRATFENPHQYAEGIRHVLVNGVLVIQDGEHTGARPGRILYGPGKR
ncbi:N-acyl-D-glutamate deacylase [bacterium HR10]|nr:N-acyl-D-glutamate deacylase [bacterium HR10]